MISQPNHYNSTSRRKLSHTMAAQPHHDTPTNNYSTTIRKQDNTATTNNYSTTIRKQDNTATTRQQNKLY